MKYHYCLRITLGAVAVATAAAAWSGNGVRQLTPPPSSSVVKVIPHRINGTDNPVTTARNHVGAATYGFIRTPHFIEMPTTGRFKLQQRVNAAKKKLRGFMIDNAQWWTSGTKEYGVYELSTTVGDAEYTAIKLDPKFYVMDAIYTGPTVWTSYAVEDPSTFQVTSMTYYTYDPATWSVINEQVGDKNLQFTASAWSPVDEMAYVTYGNTGKTFGAFMVEDGTLMSFGSTSKRMTAMACHADGTLYGIDEDGNLVEINTLTGANTKIVGNTGVVSYWRTSGAIDSDNNIFYYINCGQNATSVYAIDLETAEATKLYDLAYSEQLIGLYVVSDSTPATVPAAPVDAALNFDAGSLNGTLTFTVPNTFYDGSEASGDVSYSVTIDDDTYATETTSWGAAESVPLSVATPGNHTVTLTLTNENGNSPAVKLSQWIGSDTPAAVTNASAAWADGVFTVRWTAPTEGANGGHINTSSLRYTVVRNPDGVTVADGISETQISDPVEEPENQVIGYTYTITPTADGISGEPTTTSKKSIGYFIPPYQNNFEDSSKTTGYSVLDSNKDGKKWGYNSSSKAMRISYNSTKAMDDWLFTPAFQLQAGKSYTFSFKTRAHNNYNSERIEAAILTGTSVSSVVEYIVAPTDVSGTEWVTLSGEFTPEADGRYRLGLHGISDKDKYYLYATGIEVTAGASGDTPAAVGNLTVTPATDGSLKAVISFTTPSLDVNDNPLSSLDKIELLRGDELIHTFTSPALGVELVYTDNNAPARNVTYSVIAYNAAGTGAVAQASAFIGFDAPQPVTDLTATIGDNTGQAVLTWSAPTTDINNTTLPASAVKYTVIRTVDDTNTVVEDDLAATTFTDNAIGSDDDQKFVSYSVIAKTTGGTSANVTSQLLPLGRPHAVPFEESFANGRITYEWGLESSNSAAGWLLGQDSSIDGINSEDNDNGLAIMQALTANSRASLISGSIAVPQQGTPMLSFAYFGYDTANRLEVNVITAQSQETTTVKTITLNEGVDDQWNHVSIDLSAYKGSNIQIVFCGIVIDSSVVVIDNIRLRTVQQYDLGIRSVSMPARITPGQEYQISVAVENNGLADAGSYTVILLADDEPVASAPGTPLASAAVARFTFDRSTPATSDETVTYKARIDYAADTNADNNTSEAYTVSLINPEWPVPTDVTATLGESDTVNLQWEAPDLTVTPMQPVTDDVENYNTYSTGLAGSTLFDDYIGDWTMIDNDGSIPYSITVAGEVINYPNSGRPISFIVMEPSIFNSDIWSTHSGDRVFVSFAAQYSANDDWMVSPRLDGSAQTVKFFARALTNYYGNESFEIYYSTTDTRITSFTRLQSIAEVPESWTEYSATLPAGAKYFAIRCTSNDSFALLVDDITYTPAHPADGLVLTGYNIYRDGECITPTPVSSTSYIDTDVAAGSHTYHVTALYNRGESAISLPSDVTATGLGAVTAPSVKISTVPGVIIVTGAVNSNITVADIAGTVIAQRKGNDRMEINVLPGIYIVSTGKETHKVIVR